MRNKQGVIRNSNKEEKGCVQNSVPFGNRPLGRLWRKQKDNIESDLRGTDFEGKM
jgi:hypothetical protein